MVDKMHLTENQEEPDIQPNDDGFLLLTSYICPVTYRYNFRPFVNDHIIVNGHTYYRPCCPEYYPAHRPGRLANHIPDDVWENLSSAIVAVQRRMDQMVRAIVAAWFVLFLSLDLVFDRAWYWNTFGDAFPLFFVLLVVWEGGRWYRGSFHAVVAEHQTTFAQRGVKLFVVDETEPGRFFGNYSTSFVIFRLLDQQPDQEQQQQQQQQQQPSLVVDEPGAIV
jgi:hypothetical protein